MHHKYNEVLLAQVELPTTYIENELIADKFNQLEYMP